MPRKGVQKPNLSRRLLGKTGSGKNPRTSMVKSRKVSPSGKMRGMAGRAGNRAGKR